MAFLDKPNVLLVGEDQLFLRGMQVALESAGFTTVERCHTTKDTLRQLRTSRWSLVICDFGPNRQSQCMGLRCFVLVRTDEEAPQIRNTPVIVTTSDFSIRGELEILVEWFGTADYLMGHPLEMEDLLTKIDNLFARVHSS